MQTSPFGHSTVDAIDRNAVKYLALTIGCGASTTLIIGCGASTTPSLKPTFAAPARESSASAPPLAVPVVLAVAVHRSQPGKSTASPVPLTLPEFEPAEFEPIRVQSETPLRYLPEEPPTYPKVTSNSRRASSGSVAKSCPLQCFPPPTKIPPILLLSLPPLLGPLTRSSTLPRGSHHLPPPRSRSLHRYRHQS
jgi:hypothetical protein